MTDRLCAFSYTVSWVLGFTENVAPTVMRSSSALGGIVANGRALSDAARARYQSEQRYKGGIDRGSWRDSRQSSLSLRGSVDLMVEYESVEGQRPT
jgi:hypothetical protein